MTRTMIVDDEEDMRVLIKTAIDLANDGLIVACEAANGAEALERWRACDPDVIVLDFRMPGANGFDVATAILREQPEQRIVLFTAFLTDELRQRAERLGIRARLSKEDFAQLPDTLWNVRAA